ncbi:glycyl-radical enzyme activating protein [Vallitalea guaymasensis]|uniref:Glycyl-radical enzyme activating protein n=1 Tax=Vallitalea guaymasensis TaxID=1185412 RepID=A0A8J8M7W9_9FIRM|nr:glycyl-radical enzyme activating protein [Vallitalea guaymasensis]QUH27903.1 glycyl-radical enzyme activating protein [Vallitalea guaymasensis]
METARVFNIERFATEDGEGIRTVVFLKGCELRCKWCANPESQEFRREILFKKAPCTNCGRCIEICNQKAIDLREEFGFITNASLCNYCERCVDYCVNNARCVVGMDMSVDELIKEVLKDIEYYKMSGGGITFSGGEPLFYSRFIKECSKKLKEYNITTLVETCGYIDNKNMKEICDYSDYIFYDIKHMNSEKHKELTGKDNKLIIDNLIWLSNNYKGKLSVRYPYIPGCNDDTDSIKQFLDFIQTLDNIREVVFLPYHRLGMPKYEGLGRKYEMGDMKSLTTSDLQCISHMFKDYDFHFKIL